MNAKDFQKLIDQCQPHKVFNTDMSYKNSDDISFMYIGKFKDNTPTWSKVDYNRNVRPGLREKIDFKGHTHLSRFPEEYRLKASDDDRKIKEKLLKDHPSANKFRIITPPEPFPY